MERLLGHSLTVPWGDGHYRYRTLDPVSVRPLIRMSGTGTVVEADVEAGHSDNVALTRIVWLSQSQELSLARVNGKARNKCPTAQREFSLLRAL